MSCNMSKENLSICIGLLENGVNPESLALVIEELRKKNYVPTNKIFNINEYNYLNNKRNDYHDYNMKNDEYIDNKVNMTSNLNNYNNSYNVNNVQSYNDNYNNNNNNNQNFNPNNFNNNIQYNNFRNFNDNNDMINNHNYNDEYNNSKVVLSNQMMNTIYDQYNKNENYLINETDVYNKKNLNTTDNSIRDSKTHKKFNNSVKLEMQNKTNSNINNSMNSNKVNNNKQTNQSYQNKPFSGITEQIPHNKNMSLTEKNSFNINNKT